MKPWLRALRWVAGGVVLFGLLVGLAWLALPSFIQGQLQERGSAALGRSLRVGSVVVQPFALAVTLNKLVLGPVEGVASKDPQASIERLRVDLKWTSLFRLAPVVESLVVDGPKLRLARVAEGRYDIDDLIERLKPDPAAPPSQPPKFALYNVRVRGGEFRFDDLPVKRQQRVTKLNLTLPFLSNLPADVEVEVAPRLSFLLNGTAFDTGASATPFAQARHADMTLRFAGYQLEPLQAYLPADLHLKPRRGKIDGSLALRFTQDDDGSRVTLRGDLAARDVSISDAAGKPVVGWQSLKLGLEDVQPLARRVHLGKLRVEGLQVEVARDADGRLNLLPPAPVASVASGPVAAASAAASAAVPAAAPSDPADGWQVRLAGLELVGAQVLWRDDAVQPPAQMLARGLDLQLGASAWPLAAPVDMKLAADLVHGDKSQPAGRVVAEGSLAPQTVALALDLTDLVLDHANPYLSAALAARLEGKLSATGQLQWAQGEQPRSQLKLGRLKLAELKLREPAGERLANAAWRSLELTDTDVDLLARSVTVAKLNLTQPTLTLLRDSDGHWNWEQWLADQPPAAAAKSPAAAAKGASAVARRAPAAPKAASAVPAQAAASAPEPWKLELRDARLEGGRVRLFDAVPGDPPVALEVDTLKLAAQGLRWPSDAKTTPAALQISARVLPAGASGDLRPGLLDWRGKLLPAPLRLEGRLQAERLPVHLLEPYFAGALGVDLVRAEAGFTGEVQLRQEPQGWDASVSGNALLADLNLAALRRGGSGGGELLSWQSLALQGLKARLQPGAKPQVDIAEAALSDFYARLVVTEAGRLNLQEVGAAPPATASAASAPASAPLATSTAASAPPAAAADADELPLALTVGRTLFAGGKVDFSDRFIRPNYSAALTELNGSLGAFSSTRRDMAQLELRGRAAGTAALEVVGSLNPTARPLALDIRAKASDLELAPLSPYAGKYAGYAIERGKLTMEVDYKIQPDGRLEAKNQVVLNQLTFGDKVDSPEATKLPVLLAVALLKDRNGVIDINLPVSGSINDPQFSVGGIIVKVIVNLLTKALTAPFALLAGGSGEDLSLAEFEAGSARLTDKGRAVVDKVAQALIDRPTLRMTVTGAADPAAERAAMQAEAFAQTLRGEHRRDKLRGGAASDAVLPPPTAEERARLVRLMFADAKQAGRVRLAAGAKDPAPAEMEALLRGSVPVSADSARELALQRGLAVRDALVAKGMPAERLFLAAPKLRAAGEDDAAWTPRVQLSLAVQ